MSERIKAQSPEGRAVYKRSIRNRAPRAAIMSHDAARLDQTSVLPARSPERNRPRRLLLCLDGVPFSVITAARERGMFEMFDDPTRLLSPFPTMTNVALSTIFKATPPAGYESLYFDKGTRRLAGGVSKYIGRRTPDKIPSSYMDELDYQEPLPCEFLVYAAPDRVCFADFHRFATRFRQASAQKDYFAFLKATDGLLHICGAERLQTALVELDRVLRDIQGRYEAETEIVLFSDHGMNTQENRRIKLRKHLEAHGFRWSNSIDGDDARQIVVPAFGLCGYVALYCANEAAAITTADTLATLEGVDFSLTRDGDAARVAGKRGVARIHRRTNENGVAYSYEPESGDPLRLASACAALTRDNRIGADGFADADVWYAATADHDYPDAPANIYGAIFDARVEHTADVLVSLEDGYYYGATVFSHIARRLLATHGNALAPSTNAFLMSTHRNFGAHVRASDATSLLRD